LVVKESEGVAIYSKVLIMPWIRAFELPTYISLPRCVCGSRSFNFLPIDEPQGQ
jgi:hypothetical protein